MTTPSQPDVTAMLLAWSEGDSSALDQLAPLVYQELRRLARHYMGQERPGHTLQATALVNEAYVRLVGAESLEIQNRGHFYAVASQQMRRILVDYARANNAARRGGGAVKVDLDKAIISAERKSVDVVSLDDALKELEKLDPRAAQVIELRYFGGYTDKEVVEALGVSLATVRRDWEFARSWLFDQMRAGEKGPAKGHA